MKRIILTVAIILSVAVALTANVCGANQPVKPLRDYLLQPPNSIWHANEYREDTPLLYNIVVIMQDAQRNKLEITSLRTEVAELKQIVKNLEALVEANAAAIATLATANMVDDIQVEFSDCNDVKEMKESDK